MSGDSTSANIAFNQDNGDTSFFLFAAVTQQEINNFDLFLGVLRDTIFPIQSRSWEIPGEGNEENPLSLEAILVLMPGLDSSFVLDFFDTFSETSENQNTEDLFDEVFTALSDQLYLGLQGSLNLEVLNDSSITGNFNSVLIKPAFHLPPHLVTINDGEFSFSKTTTPSLKVIDPKIKSSDYSLFNIYPNPFNPLTNFQYKPYSRSQITLNIYDIKGRRIKTVFEGSIEPGVHNFQWHAENFSSGVYLIVLRDEYHTLTKKIILNK
jgi:hypothetical protein